MTTTISTNKPTKKYDIFRATTKELAENYDGDLVARALTEETAINALKALQLKESSALAVVLDGYTFISHHEEAYYWARETG